jgi:hypothetical protein
VYPKKNADAEATFRKFCQLGPRGAVEHYGWHADRDLVPDAMGADTAWHDFGC